MSTSALKRPHHKWSDCVRFQYHTERHCTNPCCDLIRITMHPPRPEIPFREWQWGQDGERFKTDGNRTPECKMSDGVTTL